MTKIDIRPRLVLSGVHVAERPKCVRCGKGYGYRTVEEVEVIAPPGNPPPKPETPPGMIVTRFQQLPNGDRVINRWTLWDGESFDGVRHTEPFCSITCALATARSAIEAGYKP